MEIKNKSDLFALANKGKIDIYGVKMTVDIHPDPDGDEFIQITVDPLSPLHQPLLLGGKWWEYVTDEECAELGPAIEKYKAEAEKFCELAKRKIKGHLTEDGRIMLDEIPDSVKSDWADYPQAFKRFQKGGHSIRFVNKNRAEWFALGVFTLDLDGEEFVPRWSYWLDRAYYIATPKIKLAQAF